MDTSDDPIIAGAETIAPLATIAGVGVGIHGATGGFSKRDKGGSFQRTQAGQAQRTVEPTVQLSEAARRNRRLAASSLTRMWAEPTLGIPSLGLGL